MTRYRVERRQETSGTLTLTLPMPPSTNSLFANLKGGGRICTASYDKWKREAMLMIMAQKVGRLSGRVTVEIQLEDRHPTRDCDNGIKAIVDILADQRVNIIDGDNAMRVRKVSAEWSSNVEGAMVLIRRA